MKKILGIIGSPRGLGNCEIMVKEISRNIDVNHELLLLRLSEFNVLPCRGCYSCLFGKNRCILDDDLYKILDAISASDALIVAAPTYVFSVNSSLKRFTDRFLSFFPYIDELWGRPSVGVGIAGVESNQGHTLLGIHHFLKALFTDKKKSLMIFGALPGEIFLNEANKRMAAELASALFGPAPIRKQPCCPLCGENVFQFFSDNRVQCMLCSNTGTMAIESGQPVFKIDKCNLSLLLSKEDALKGRELLRSMKKDFMEKKTRLAEISARYFNGGTWIRP
jgi:NAD(P)H-dependent FMN reductase